MYAIRSYYADFCMGCEQLYRNLGFLLAFEGNGQRWQTMETFLIQLNQITGLVITIPTVRQ